MNPITRFIQAQKEDKAKYSVKHDHGSAANLNLTQVVLLEQSMNTDARGNLVVNANGRTIPSNPKFDIQINSFHNPNHKLADLWIGPTD